MIWNCRKVYLYPDLMQSEIFCLSREDRMVQVKKYNDMKKVE